MKDLDFNRMNIVTQANNLVEARYTISKNEQLILLAMLSFIDPEDDEFLTYRTSISQFANLLGLDNKNRIKEVKAVTKKLLSRVVTVNTPTGWEMYQWVSYAKADYKEDSLLLKFHDHLKPYLLDLKSRFTSFKLSEVIDLKSIYAIRVYQLLKDFDGQKKLSFTYTLSDFRAIVFGEGSKKYPLFKNFRIRIIDKAKSELDAKASLSFTYKTIRVGRSIGKIEFTIIKKSQSKPAIPPVLPTRTRKDQGKNQPEEIQKMINIGVVKKKAISLLKEHGKEKIIKALKFTAEEDRKNPAGFFISILKNGWSNPVQQKEEKQKAKVQARREKEEKVREIEKMTEKLSSQFTKIAIEKYLSSLTEEDKEMKLQGLKNEYPQISEHIKSLYKGAGAGFLLREIPNYSTENKIFINTELKKLGLI